MDLGLRDAAAVVVGGGRGMGLATAHCLAEDGARVAVVGRSKEVLDHAAADLRDRGSPDAVALIADTADDAQVQQIFAHLGDRWGGELNILVNAVGPTVRGTFDGLTDDDWRRAVDEGVMGMVHCVRAALPLLRTAQWGRIVNFSAHSTQRQSVILPAYAAAKSMVTSISKNLSLLLARDEILVNVVSPGSIASDALLGWAESAGVDGSDPYALMSAIDEHFGHPAHLPRAGFPDEIGPAHPSRPRVRRRYRLHPHADDGVPRGTGFPSVRTRIPDRRRRSCPPRPRPGFVTRIGGLACSKTDPDALREHCGWLYR